MPLLVLLWTSFPGKAKWYRNTIQMDRSRRIMSAQNVWFCYWHWSLALGAPNRWSIGIHHARRQSQPRQIALNITASLAFNIPWPLPTNVIGNLCQESKGAECDWWISLFCGEHLALQSKPQRIAPNVGLVFACIIHSWRSDDCENESEFMWNQIFGYSLSHVKKITLHLSAFLTIKPLSPSPQ